MSGKAPAFQFYPGDWLKDPALAMCSPATRGIWIDLLCAMHESRTGELSGTAAQLARVARCTEVEMLAALAELASTKAAEVSEESGTVRVMSRRMQRDIKARREWSLQKQRQRCPENVRDVSGQCPAVSSSSTTLTTPQPPASQDMQPDSGGGGNEIQEPPPPEEPRTAKGKPEKFSDEAWERITANLPAIRRRGLARAAVETVCAGHNGKTAIYLAVLAEACADDQVRKPLAVVRSRLDDGAKPDTLRAARRALEAPQAQSPPVEESPAPVLTRTELLAIAERAEARGCHEQSRQARMKAESML